MTERAAVTEERAGHPCGVQELFDLKAGDWPAKYAPGGRLVGRLERLSAEISRLATPAGQVLDLGCGTGELARRLAASGLRVAACDISARMLRQASRDRGSRVAWVQLDPRWLRLPLRTGSVDVVVASSVLEYVTDPAAVLGECGRVLRTGGTLVCTVPDLRHPIRWLEGLARKADRSALPGAAAARWPGPRRYLAYLRLSGQRHPVRRWRALASQAGLRLATGSRRGRPAPLRLLTFSHLDKEDEGR